MKRFWKVLCKILAVAAIAGLSCVLTAMYLLHDYRVAVDDSAVEYKMERIAALLDEYFIDEYDLKTLEAAAADGAAAAMVEATGDKWSYYISAEQMQAYEEQMNNEYVGIGVTIQVHAEGVEIMEVFAGSPAAEAGIEVGDICIEVEGQLTKEMGTEGTQDVVRGKAGTTVNMTFLRGNETYTVDVERRGIVMPVAEWQMLDNAIAWIAINNFDSHCAEHTLNCISEALEQGAEALLFDVRFNGGGYKDEMVEILDELLPEGDIFRSVDYRGKEEVDTSDADCLVIPMAVLVNEESYSAAEFFAAALQEYGVADVIGVQTTGKGNFQYTLDLGDGSAVAISSGKYCTPNGISLTDVGITPDVVVDLDDEDFMALYYSRLEPAEDEQLQAAVEVLLDKIS